MIEVKNVVKTFDGFAALNDATISVPTGAVYGLVGPNGAGKSTIIRHLTGIFRQDSGTVRLGGEDVWENAALKAKIAAIPDDWYYFNSAGIGDMMRFYKGFYPNFSTERYEKLREVFELDEKRPIRRFSKGMQKQAAFLLGLACETEYLLCDETLDGLDPVMRKTVRRIIASEVAERGLTVIFASHNLGEIEDICDHVALLHKGELLFEAGLDDIKTGIHKIQVSFEKSAVAEAKRQLESLDKVSLEQRGSLFTVIARGDEKYLEDYMHSLSPLFVEFIPLTLEEIFIAEMEERGYEFHEKILS